MTDLTRYRQDTETLDKLYLELSQFTTARTARDIANEKRISELEQSLAEYKDAEYRLQVKIATAVQLLPEHPDLALKGLES